jgi:hypothetical protein
MCLTLKDDDSRNDDYVHVTTTERSSTDRKRIAAPDSPMITGNPISAKNETPLRIWTGVGVERALSKAPTSAYFEQSAYRRRNKVAIADATPGRARLAR